MHQQLGMRRYKWENHAFFLIQIIQTIFCQIKVKIKLQIYLDAYLLRFTKNLSLKQIATELGNKRIKILKQRGSRRAMDRSRTEKFLSTKPEPESLQRQILRFRQKAEIILNNVCKGVFPGDYS